MLNKMKVDLGFARLIVEKEFGGDWVAVYIEGYDGVFIQDIALIEAERKNCVKCCVWADPYDESYTDAFIIRKYNGREERVNTEANEFMASIRQ